MSFSKRLLSIVLALALVLCLTPGAALAFSDMRESTHWAYEALNAAVESGLLSGYDDGSLRPVETVTRAEAAAIINRAFGGKEAAKISFSDVSPDDWYYQDVAKAVAFGSFTGVSAAEFDPKSDVTREQVFTVLARALKLEAGDTSALLAFTDGGDVSGWAAPYVAAMAAAGFISGSGSALSPKDGITREQLAQALYNVLGQKGDWAQKTCTSDGETVQYLAMEGVSYCQKPVDAVSQTMSVFVPTEFINSDGSVNHDVVINGYLAETAPVVFVCGAGDFAAQYGDYIKNGYVVAVCGSRSQESDAIVDLKAAVRYLKANDDALPGDSDMIVSVGGTLSDLLGTAGGSGDYLPYLEAIGADMTVSDDVYAAVCYSPAVGQESADDGALLAAMEDGLAAYLVSAYSKSSGGMSNYTYLDEEACAAYVDGLNKNGSWVSLDFIKATASTGPSQLVEYSSGVTVKMTSLADFVAKYPAASEASTDNSDDGQSKLRNPMSYIGTDEACTAPYFRVRVGAKDALSVNAIGLNLALALDKEEVSVNYQVAWDEVSADYGDELVPWIERICKTEAEYTESQIAAILNVKNSVDYGWTALDTDSDGVVDGYRLNKALCVACPEIAGNQGISVTVPAKYLNSDFTINHTGTVNGYTADTAPIVLNTGAAGYSQSATGNAGTGYLKDGYINVACGNRGKQSSAVSAEGEKYFCGDSPYCLVDQKAAVRWLKYNIALGNIPGDGEKIVSKGGSGGGAHAIMMAAMSNNPDYFPYLEKAGALMSYTDESGEKIQVSDGVFGCDPLSPITCLEEADMSYEWQWGLATGDRMNQSKLSEFRHILSDAMAKQYVKYVNSLGLKDENGTPLTINDDGLTGTYVDYFEARLVESLEWYLNNLDENTLNWLPENGESYAEAYINGHYYKTSRVMGGGYADGTGNTDTGATTTANGTDLSSWVTLKKDENGLWDADFAIGDYFNYATRSKTNPSFDDLDLGQAENQEFGDSDSDCRHFDQYVLAAMTESYDALAAAYDGEAKAETFDEIYKAYQHDLAEIEAGDEFGSNIVYLYNPTRYIVDEETELPSHVRIVTGTKDTDASLTVSLNCYIEFKMMGVDTVLGWSWDQGHCGSAPLNTTFQLWLNGVCGQ